MQTSSRICGAFAALVLFGSAGVAIADPTGLWRDKDGGTIRTHACGSALCGTTTSVVPAIDPATGKPPTDKNNLNPTKRNRPLVGLQVLIAMKPNGAGKWSGSLYDNDTGKNYVGHLIEVDAGTVRVEGCALGVCGDEQMKRVR